MFTTLQEIDDEVLAGFVLAVRNADTGQFALLIRVNNTAELDITAGTVNY